MTEDINSIRNTALDLWLKLCDQIKINPDKIRPRIRELTGILDAGPMGSSYHDLPAEFFAGMDRLFQDLDSTERNCVPDLVLLELIARFDKAFEYSQIPDLFLPEFFENMNRILQRAALGKRWASSSRNDIFLKDLGILRITLIPCVSHLIFRNSGVPRRIVARQSSRDFVQALRFFAFKTHGFSPFMENHVHTSMLKNFNPRGREKCYRLVAQLLQIWPENRGLMGLCWYYDPVISKISPHLAYLYSDPKKHNALFLPAGSGQDAVNGALSKSATRRHLYEQGLYHPMQYLMVWPRKDILRCYGG